MEDAIVDSDSIPRSWERIVSDLKAMTDEYVDKGWEVWELHPGDVTLCEEEEPKMKVLVADNEFPDIDEDGDLGFDSYQVYRAVDGGGVYLIVAIENRAEESVILVPAHYTIDENVNVRRQAVQEKAVTLVLHRLDERSPLKFECTNPSLIFED